MTRVLEVEDLRISFPDAAGRRQYLYHPDYRAAQERAKYDRLVRFGEHLFIVKGVGTSEGGSVR